MREKSTLTMLVEPEPPTLVALTNCGDPSMFVCAKVTEGLLAYDFDLTLLAPKQITVASSRISDHTVTADGIAGNLADVRIRA